MTDTSSLTGGQLCVRGILHQMLRGLAHGMSLVIKPGIFDGSALNSVMLILEPAAGGDHQAVVGNRRIVEQVKIRSNGKPWTAGDIAEEVLPDLLLAVDPDAPETLFRFTTDGALNCPDLIKLCNRLAGRAVPDDVLAALDDSDKRAFKYGAWLSERDYFQRLAKRAGCKDLSRLWSVLAALEIEGDLVDEGLINDIDAFLGDIVDAHEQVEAKRDQLIGTMMRLARDGANVMVDGLLAEAGMPIERTLHYARLPDFTHDALDFQLGLIGYKPALDIRRPPPIEPLGLSLIAGDSGYGKSWRMAGELKRRDENGELTVWVSNATSMATVLDKVVEVVWHTSFDADQKMPGLKRRLGHRYVDGQGAWLTVGVDDVQNRALVEEMRAANWGAYGVRLLATVPTEIANSIAAKPMPPDVHAVGKFTLPELRRFLRSHDKELRALPDDVLELLQTPIFAELYRLIDTPDWAPTSEYALIHRYWRHATYDVRDMADHQDDLVALAKLAGTVLTTAGRYPWPPAAAAHAGLDQDARKRLVEAGILRQSEAGSQVIHDRVLNWAVARSLAVDLSAGAIEPDGVVAALIAIGQPETLAPGIGSRLGYVLLDFLWLAAGMVDGPTVATIISKLIDNPEYRINAGSLIEEHLTGLGSRILPALKVLSTTPDANRGPIAAHAAKAIGAIGVADAGSADATVIGLIAETTDELAVKAGLTAAAIVPVPQALNQLWAIHLVRRTASNGAPDDDTDQRFKLYRRQEASRDALTTAIVASPDFIETKLAQTSDALAAEILLDVLLKVDHATGREVWGRAKTVFLSRVPAGNHLVPDAIGRFGDVDEVERLETPTDSHGWTEPHRRFNALIRIAPERASGHLSAVEFDVVSRGWFSVPRLIRNGGSSVRTALRGRQKKGWEGMADLADLYRHHSLLIDADSFVAIIAAFEARLAEVEGKQWEVRRERSLLQFLANTTRPDLLAILKTYRGSEFERLLCDRAIGNGRRTTLCVDSDADHCERLLLAIGGDGYGRAVAAALADPSPFSRVDGDEAAAKLLPESAFAGGLAKAVDDADRDRRENYDLMVALAVHQLDGALYKLVMATSSAFNDAIDIRKKKGPWPASIDAQVRLDLTSDDSETRIGATCALAMAPPSDVTDLLAETLARCPDDDPSALTVVRMASHLEAYHPAMLGQLIRMAELPDEKRREEVVCYLAEHGDEQARTVVTAMLSANLVGPNSHATLRAAYALTTHDPKNPVATAKLLPFIERSYGMYPVGMIARRLHEGGALAGDAVVDIGYMAKRLSAADVYLLVERIAETDPEEAFAISERRFDEAPSAGSARQLIDLGGAPAIDHLLAAYDRVGAHEVKWIIARALRRHADRMLVLGRLGDLAKSEAASERLTAAELLGWLPGPQPAQMLAELAVDEHPDVSDAAIEAEERMLAERHAKELIAEIPLAEHYGKWSRLWALTDIVDPFLLEMDNDGLAIGPMLDGLDEVFAIWTEKALVDRKKAVIKEAERLDQA